MRRGAANMASMTTPTHVPRSDALIDLVDIHDNVIGQALRSRMRADNLRHRCTAVLVLDRREERLLVHQRSRHKDLWPLWWDLAAGGVVEAGEDLDRAAARELAEELGVTADLMKLGSRHHQDTDVDVFMHVWLAHHDGPFVFTDGEIEQTQWLTPVELAARLTHDRWCRDSVAVALPMLAHARANWQQIDPTRDNLTHD
jgi:8-oxo-dGTP pyrophosphatase MutT (NUDIX family)